MHVGRSQLLEGRSPGNTLTTFPTLVTVNNVRKKTGM